MSEPTRQRYALATGKGLDKAPPRTSNPGFKGGGKVSKNMKPARTLRGAKRGG